jgi:hypothetical protein
MPAGFDCHRISRISDKNATQSDQETLWVRINRPNLFASRCKHQDTIVVRSAGMERIVCEDCGHISFSFDIDLTDEPESVSEQRMHPAET